MDLTTYIFEVLLIVGHVLYADLAHKLMVVLATKNLFGHNAEQRRRVTGGMLAIYLKLHEIVVDGIRRQPAAR